MRKHYGVTDWRTAFKEGRIRAYLSDFLHHKLVEDKFEENGNPLSGPAVASGLSDVSQ